MVDPKVCLQPFLDRQTFAVKRLSKEFYARKQMTDKAVGAGKMGLVQGGKFIPEVAKSWTDDDIKELSWGVQ